MDRLKLVGTFFGYLGLGFAMLGCLGGNAMIGIAQVSLLICFVLLSVDRVRIQNTVKSKPAFSKLRMSSVFLIALVIFCGLSLLANLASYDSPFRDFKKLRYEAIVLLLLLTPVFRGVFCNEKTCRFAFWLLWSSAVIVVGGGYLGLFAGYNPLTGEPSLVPGRLGGVSGTQMTFGYTLQFFVLACASLLVFELKGGTLSGFSKIGKKVRLTLLAGTFTFLFGALYLSFCRGALLSVGVGFLVLLILSRNAFLWGGLILITIITASVSQKTGSRYTQYIHQRGGFTLNSGDAKRVAQWKAAALTFFDHPLTGVGHRQFEKQSHILKEEYGFEPDNKPDFYFKGHAHNNYLEAFASSGVFGGISFLGFCICWLIETCRSKHARLFFVPLVAAFVVSGFFENTFTDSEVLHTILLIYFLSQVVMDRDSPSVGPGSKRFCDDSNVRVPAPS